MDFISRHVGGGVIAQLIIVIFLAIREFPDPGIVVGFGAKAGEIIDIALVSRIDRVVNLIGGLIEETGAILFADILGLLQLFLEGNIKDIFLGRLVDKFLHDLK